LGIVYRFGNRIREARECCLRALPHQEELARAHPGVIEYISGLAVTYVQLGNLAEGTGRSEERLDWYGKAASRFRELLKRDAGDSKTKANLTHMHRARTDLLYDLGQYEKVLREATEGLAVSEGEAGDALRLKQALALAR